MEESSFESRLRSLEKRTRFLAGSCLLLLFALSASFVAHMPDVRAAEDPQILRVKGLIIEDNEKHARILLGAPFPSVSERLRKGTTGTSLVFLDEQGYDRFRVGEMLPAAEGFHRIGSSYGLTILDTKGNERGGLGFLSNGKNVNRATFALDRTSDGSAPGDAVGMIVDDTTGLAGISVMYPPTKDHDQDAIMIGTQGGKAFVTLKDLNGRDGSTLALSDGTPSFKFYEQPGDRQRDLLIPSPGSR